MRQARNETYVHTSAFRIKMIKSSFMVEKRRLDSDYMPTKYEECLEFLKVKERGRVVGSSLLELLCK